jgi:hypothetical protein
MNVAEYAGGFALVAAVAAAYWVSGCALAARLTPGWEGAPGTLVRVVLALSLAIVTCELLGLFGWLTGFGLTVASLALAAALHFGLGRKKTEYVPRPPAPRAGRALTLIALTLATLTAVRWAGPVLQSLDVGIYRQDSTWYHLPLAAWFAQTGSVGGLLTTDPLKLTVWFYPLNSELLHAAGMVLLGNDLLSPLLNFGWMGVALLAAWCIGRPRGLGPVTLLGALVLLDSDLMIVQAGNAPSDMPALACLLAAVAILANGLAAGAPEGEPDGAARRIPTGPLVVAALAAGLAAGTKITMLVPVAVLTAGVLAVELRAGRGRRAALWLGGVFATGSFWYLRNLVEAGNPVPWIQAGPLPGPHQEAIYPRPPHSLAGYLADHSAWSNYFVPGLHEMLGPLWFVVAFAALAGLVLGLRRRRPLPIVLLALAGVATLVAYVFVPVSAAGPSGAPYGFTSNLRYAAPAIAIGLVLLPPVETRAIARRVLFPAYAALIVVGAIASSEWIQPHPWIAIAIGLVAVAVPSWALTRPAGRARVAVLAVAALAAVVALYPQQRQYFEDSYSADLAPPLDNPGFRSTPQWKLIQTWVRGQHNLRIGIVGEPAAFGQYVFYGRDLSNEVRYIGEPIPHGGLTTVHSCIRWRQLVDEGEYDVLVITPETNGSGGLPPQIAWTAGNSATPILEVPPAAVYRLTGPLDPLQCRNLPGTAAGPNRVPGFRFPGTQEGLRFPGTADRRRPRGG